MEGFGTEVAKSFSIAGRMAKLGSGTERRLRPNNRHLVETYSLVACGRTATDGRSARTSGSFTRAPGSCWRNSTLGTMRPRAHRSARRMSAAYRPLPSPSAGSHTPCQWARRPLPGSAAAVLQRKVHVRPGQFLSGFRLGPLRQRRRLLQVAGPCAGSAAESLATRVAKLGAPVCGGS